MPRKIAIFTITPNGTIIKRVASKNPSLKDLQAACEGFIEIIPHLRKFEYEGMKYNRGTAWCNEDGRIKGLPYNDQATKLWLQNLGKGPFSYKPMLFGNVVFHATETQNGKGLQGRVQ